MTQTTMPNNSQINKGSKGRNGGSRRDIKWIEIATNGSLKQSPTRGFVRDTNKMFKNDNNYYRDIIDELKLNCVLKRDHGTQAERPCISRNSNRANAFNRKKSTIPNTDGFNTIVRRFREKATFIRRRMRGNCRIRILH